MRASAVLACAATVLLGADIAGRSFQPDPALSEVMTVATAYVGRFIDRFTNVVSEERYVQEQGTRAMSGNSSSRQRRDLRSDFLLVKPSDAEHWIPFRDVYEVDSAPVRDREQRLMNLFVGTAADAVQRAAQIAAESARFNIGNLQRTVNNPVLAIAFLQPGLQPRFRYELRGRAADVGAAVWVVGYREQARPTLIKGAFDRDIPAEGRYWIDVDGGRVVRTEFSLADVSVTARVTTRFEMDPRFGIAVPVEMTESYLVTTTGALITGRATYGSFRRFDVTATETIDVRN